MTRTLREWSRPSSPKSDRESQRYLYQARTESLNHPGDVLVSKIRHIIPPVSRVVRDAPRTRVGSTAAGPHACVVTDDSGSRRGGVRAAVTPLDRLHLGPSQVALPQPV
jgi:hypothetical protein